MSEEPVIHSHHTDSLPGEHNLAFEQVSCMGCGRLVHAFNNECMRTWVEWGEFHLCFECAIPALIDEVSYNRFIDICTSP